MPSAEPKRRTKTGCLTCRKRRVRCDELHPTCSACIRLKLTCVYPTPQPQLPNNLGRPPQTSDRPRPGRPRLSAAAGTQSADRPRLGRPPRSGTPSKEKRRQTVGGNTGSEDIEMGDGESSGTSLFPGLVKAKAKQHDQNAASSSSAPSTPANDVPWYTQGPNSNAGTKSSSRGSSKPATGGAESSHMATSNRLADVAVGKFEKKDKSFGLSKDRSSETSDFITMFNNSPGQTPNGYLTDKTKRTVTITAADQEPFQHFMSTMVKFCQLRNSGEDNLYCNILTSMGLFHESLFNAMMAWSSLHLAHLRNKPTQDAEVRHDNACTLLQKDSSNGTHIDVILATMWFLIEYERLLASGVDKVRKLLDLATEAIQAELGSHGGQTSLSRIGPIGSIVLVWMSAVDCQAAHFGGAGRILGQLQMYPHITQFIEKSAVTEDTPMSMEWSAVNNKSDETKQLQACMNLNLRTMILTGQIVLLGRWQPAAPDSPSWMHVNAGLESLEKEVEKDTTTAAVEAMAVARGGYYATPPTLSALGYNRLLLLAAYYAAIIMYQQHGPSSVPEESRDSNVIGVVTEDCAARIIRIAQRICRERPNTPQAVLTTLFIAAMVIKDQVYQAWAVSMFEKAERWGANMVKARKLLQQIIDRQNGSGVRVDFVKVMEETTGYFIV